MIFVGIFSFIAFATTLIITKKLIHRMRKIGMTGPDENKINTPPIPEMGGLAIISGFTVALLFAIFSSTFLGEQLNDVVILSTLVSVLIVGIVGIADDLFNLPQNTKAILPLLAAIPLIAIKVGFTAMNIPFFGLIDFGLLYIFLFVPIAVTVCSNLTNMFAGYNGLEVGLGAIIIFTLGILTTSGEVQIIAFAMCGALIAFYLFNSYPARIFPGDVGTLPIGAVIASVVILGNVETAGVMLMVLYIIDFIFKLSNRFPHTYQDLKDGLLYPKNGKVVALAQVPMVFFDGIHEKKLVRLFILIQIAICIATLFIFVYVFK